MRPRALPLSADALEKSTYAPPVKEASPDAAADGGRRAGKRALWCLAAGVALGVVTFLGIEVTGWLKLGILGFGAATIVVLAGAMWGIASLVQAARAPHLASTGLTVAVVLAVLANGFMAFVGAGATLVATFGFSRGRQLRRFGRVLLPPVEAGAAWAETPMSLTVEEALRPGLAAQWRENGRTEHASVAAFARLTLDLMALGAPPALVAASNRDALDEIRHTELCFSLARALDGKQESPAAFPAASRARTLPAARTLALAVLAVDSLVDGALHEGVSARVIAALAKRCEEPQIRAVLKEIAADEGRHAAHGWDVVEWCLSEGGSAVADALRGALQALPRAGRSELPEAAEDGQWERAGIHGRALEAEAFAKTRADLVQRLGRMLGDRVGPHSLHA
jgi:hypothetical protein